MINLRQPMRILLADDDSDDTDFFRQALSMIPFKNSLATVQDGKELVSYLEQCSQIPHILFLDLNMPKMKGIEALRLLRKEQKYRNLVIAIYSTSSRKSDIEDALASGANCYIVKPYESAKMRTTIEYVLSTQWQFHLCSMDIDNFVISL